MSGQPAKSTGGLSRRIKQQGERKGEASKSGVTEPHNCRSSDGFLATWVSLFGSVLSVAEQAQQAQQRHPLQATRCCAVVGPPLCCAVLSSCTGAVDTRSRRAPLPVAPPRGQKLGLVAMTPVMTRAGGKQKATQQIAENIAQGRSAQGNGSEGKWPKGEMPKEAMPVGRQRRGGSCGFVSSRSYRSLSMSIYICTEGSAGRLG